MSMEGSMGTPVSLISIVDDDPSIRESVSSLIRSAGYRSAVFESAEAFLGSDKLDETACVVLDVRMPGLGGLELQRRLAEDNRGVPLIFMTAHTEDGLRESVLQRGAVAFLGKPFTDEELFLAIQSALG